MGQKTVYSQKTKISPTESVELEDMGGDLEDMGGEKYCPVCKRTKPASAFYRSKEHAQGLSWQCKACKREYERKINTETE